jgi:rod shape-determining protein MreC
VPASVIAAGGAYSDTVTIDAGSSNGITANETVLNGDGLVGTVTAVSSTTATVQLANDAGATVGIRMAGSGQIGALTGTTDSFGSGAPLKLTLFSANATLKPGQELVTFGSVGGRPYVPGIPVGKVTSVTTEPGSLTPTALVKPFADFTGLGVVGVVTSK